MNFSLYIAKRYLFTKNSNNAINVISKIAATGVVFGSMLLLVVLAGFSGLKAFSLSYSSLIDPDFKILPKSGKRLQVNENQKNLLLENTKIIDFSEVIEEKVFLQFGDKNELATLKGVDENYSKTVLIDSIIVSGQWIAPKSQQTVLGFLLANKLEVGVFNQTNSLELFVPTPGLGQVNKNAFNKTIAQNVGLFEITEELNQQLIFTSIEAARNLLKYDDKTISSIEIKAKKNIDEFLLKEELQKVFNGDVIIKNRLEQNDALHKMLNTENVAVYLIATLILIIALFNVIGSIIMMIVAKKTDLRTLSNLGLPLKKIKNIFFLQGALLSIICGSLGVLLGVLLISAQISFELVTIPGTSFAYPVELNIRDVVLVFVTIFILGLIASKVASYRISKKIIFN